MIGYADAMALAEQGGPDVEQMLEVAVSGMGSSRAFKELAPKLVEGDFQPGFWLSTSARDIGACACLSLRTLRLPASCRPPLLLYDMSTDWWRSGGYSGNLTALR